MDAESAGSKPRGVRPLSRSSLASAASEARGDGMLDHRRDDLHARQAQHHDSHGCNQRGNEHAQRGFVDSRRFGWSIDDLVVRVSVAGVNVTEIGIDVGPFFYCDRKSGMPACMSASWVVAPITILRMRLR